MKAHRHFVRTQTKEHFTPKEKKKYPFLRIALASLLQIGRDADGTADFVSGGPSQPSC